MGTVLSISINNLLNATWLYFLILEPRFSRSVTVSLVAVWFAGIEAFSLATLSWTQGAPFLLFALGFCITVAYQLGMCLLMSRAGPLKVLFLYMVFFQNTWTLVFIIQNILGRDPLTWNLSGIVLNALILLPFTRYLKPYYLRMCQDIESGHGVITAIAALEFFIMSVILLYTPYEPDFNAQKIFFLLSLLILAAVVHILLFRLLAQIEQQKQLQHMALQGRLLLSQIEAYEQMQQESLRRQHDTRHHVAALEELIARGDNEEALGYLKQIQSDAGASISQGNSPQGVERFCENRMVNTIISAYARRARQAGIVLHADIALGPRTAVSDMDFVVILANILENAIRACREVQGSGVSLHIRRKGRKLAVICVNACRRDVAFKGGLPAAVPGHGNGIGVKSVLHAAKKYGGDADFSLILPEEPGLEAQFKCAVILDDPGSGPAACVEGQGAWQPPELKY